MSLVSEVSRRGPFVDDPSSVYSSYPADVLQWIEAELPGHVSGADFIGLGAYRLGGTVDLTVLRQALDDLVVAHSILRTVLVSTKDGYRHRMLAPASVPVRVVDAGPVVAYPGGPAGGRDAPPALVEAALAEEFPGDRVPLLRAVVGRHSATEWTLVLVGQHSAVDHWSMELLMRDLALAYRARAAGDVPGLTPPQYADSARAARGRYRPERVQRAVRHWRQVLSDLPALVPAVATAGRFDREFRFVVRLDRAVLARVSRAARTTPFVTLLASYCLTLGEVAGVDEVAVPLFTSGRERTDWDTVGPFMNTIVVRVDLSGRPSPAEVVARTHQAFITAFANEVPLAALLPEVPAVARLYAEHGVPVAGFELVQFPREQIVGFTCDRLPIGPRHGATVLPISGLLCWLEADRDDEYVGTIRYRAGLFDEEWVSGLAARFAGNLQHVVTAGRDDVVGV